MCWCSVVVLKLVWFIRFSIGVVRLLFVSSVVFCG